MRHLCRPCRDNDRAVVPCRELSSDIHRHRIMRARKSRIVVVVEDQKPPSVVPQAKPRLDSIHHVIEVTIEVEVGKSSKRWVISTNLQSDTAEAQLQRLVVVRVEPEDGCVLLSVSADIPKCELSLSHATETVKHDRRSSALLEEDLVYLSQFGLPRHKLNCFWHGR